MKLSNAKRIALTLASLVAGIGIIAVMVVIPAITGIISLSKSITEERARIQKTISRALNIRQTTEDLALLKEKIPELEAMIVKSGKEISLFTLLENKSAQYDLKEVLRLGEQKSGPQGTSQLPLEIEVRGAFLNALRFIVEVERSPVLIPINQIVMRAIPRPQEPTPEFAAILNGAIYVTQTD